MSLAHSIQNDTRFDDLMKDVRAFARDEASGEDALRKLGMRVVQAAADGVIEPYDPKVHSKDNPDDCARIYNEYVREKSRKAIDKHTINGVKANISKLRAVARLGFNPNCDGVMVADAAMRIRSEQAAAGEKVKPAFAALVDVARAQDKQDTPLTEEQLRDIVTKGEPAERTVEQELQTIQRKLDNLINGTNGLVDQSDEVVAAYEAITRRLNFLTMSRERDEMHAQLTELAAQLGLKVVSLSSEAA